VRLDGRIGEGKAEVRRGRRCEWGRWRRRRVVGVIIALGNIIWTIRKIWLCNWRCGCTGAAVYMRSLNRWDEMG